MSPASRLLVILALLGAASAPAAAQIVRGPIRNPANGHDYVLITVHNWQEYVSSAASQGGYPAVINNAAENEWVRANFADWALLREILIGLTDLAVEGDFAWAAGTVDGYTNWAPGEPNNFNDEDLTVMTGNGSWVDTSASFVFNFRSALVEINPPGSQPTGISAGPLCDAATNTKYYLTTATTFDGAESFAQSLGGHLATIKDPRTNRLLMRSLLTLPNVGPLVTIGLTDRAVEGTFVWADGDPSPFRFWASTEPNNVLNEDYVTISTAIDDPNSGRWYDSNDSPRTALIAIPPPVTPTFCPADFNRSGLVSVQDIFDFLAAYFAGCP